MSAEVTLGWNNARLAAGARQASAIVDSTTAKMKGAFAGLAATGGAFLGVREIVEATVKYDSLRLGMVSLTGSVEAATDRMSELRTLAKDPGLGFEQVVETDIRLRSAGISASVSERAIREFGNALAVVGKGKAELDGVALALSQIASKGKVSAEEINQIAERVPQIRTVMKDVFGTADTEEIQKMGIPVESFITLVVDGFSRTIPRAIVGLQGKWDNFTDALTGRLADFGGAVLEEMIKPIESATEALEKGEGAVVGFGDRAAGFAADWLSQFGAVGEGANGLAQSIANIFASDYWQQGARLEAQMAKIAPALREQKRLMDEATKAAQDAAAQEKKYAEEKQGLNAYLDVYIAKQSRANAETEAAATAAKKQSDELKKLQDTLDAASEKTSMSLASPKVQLKNENKKADKIEEDINTAEFTGDEKKAVELKIEREAISQRIGQLERQIKADTEAQVELNQQLADAANDKMEAAAKETQERDKAMQLFALELAIAEAASRGQDAKVAKLERERDIIEQTTRLMNELGVSYDEAAKLAERLVNAEQKGEERKKGGDGERSKIMGYSQSQGDATAARARALEGVDSARAKYDRMGGQGESRFAAEDAAQKAKFGSLFGNAPAAETAAKAPDSGINQVMSALEKWASATTETFERAFQ